jgi:hypothetical protein
MTAQGHLAEFPTRLGFRQSVFTRPSPRSAIGAQASEIGVMGMGQA